MTKKQNKNSKKDEKIRFTKPVRLILLALMWVFGLFPLFGILYLRYVVTDQDNLPSPALLESQEELLATTVYADDGITELGKYWKVNRTSVGFEQISPNVVSALISTEDERFKEHTGIDPKALARALTSMGEAGGASTISQQLAKLIFTLKEREDKQNAMLAGEDLTEEEKTIKKMSGIERRVYEKIRENVIALRLEKRYTKDEIITMYLNQFDFLYNAVGIASAAKVYFNKKPSQLNPEEAAILVGMCKNPGLYNPFSFKIKNYRQILARKNNIDADDVQWPDILELRTHDSLRAVNRRNTVLYKWMENSEKENPALSAYISREEYDSLKQLPIVTNYQTVDHKEGIAPYFREAMRNELRNILKEKDNQGNFRYAKKDGSPYSIYEDGLRVYTTLNANLQKHAEFAVKNHLSKNIQEPFDKNNRRMRSFPFDSRIPDQTVENLMNSAIKRSDRYRNEIKSGASEAEALKSFQEPTEMKIFSWEGEIDTLMTPLDSIRYYKNIMRAGLVSVEPQTGFIKAWVGGPDIKHFGYDHVRQGKRQVGSTIKPFIYSAGMRFGVITPCMKVPNIEYCVDVQTGPNPTDMTSWCPKNAGSKLDGLPKSFMDGLVNSDNNMTVAVMSKMGGVAGPNAVAKLMRDLNIEIRHEDVVPAMCLGVMDLSLLELTAAQSAFVNKGIYNSPTAILRVEDRNGNVIYESIPNSKEAMSEDLAYATLDMMKQVVTRGTAASLRGTWRGDWGGITYPTAGKTGTTQNNSDGWFMALTPDLVTGVWVGAEDMAIRFRSMEWGQGARLALPIYGYMMQRAYKDPKIKISKEDFEVPYGYQNSIYNCTNSNGQSDNGSTTLPFRM